MTYIQLNIDFHVYINILILRLKCIFSPLTFKNLQFWSSEYKNYNFDPLKFSPFASLVLLVNFDLFNAYVAGHVCN